MYMMENQPDCLFKIICNRYIADRKCLFLKYSAYSVFHGPNPLTTAKVIKNEFIKPKLLFVNQGGAYEQSYFIFVLHPWFYPDDIIPRLNLT